MSVQIMLAALGTTLLVFAGSFTLGALLGVPVVLARRSRSRALRSAGATWVSIVTGIPPLVWLFIFFFGITIAGTRLSALVAATVALGVIGSAHIAEAYRAGLSAVPSGQLEALEALSVPRWHAFRLVILPQALPVTIASVTAYAINLLKDTALASLIGVQEITFLANDRVQRGSDGLITFLIAGSVYVALSVPLGVLSRSVYGRLQRKLNAGVA